MKLHLLLCFLVFGAQAYGATPCVPSRIRFADMQLKISKGAKERIQEKVDSLTQSDRHFQELVNRFNLFLPIIERILKEENVPEAFKYIVLQESSLVADLVSTSNAVGFWQFKEPASREVGLKIDQYVDERMHIGAATRGAAKYLKRNNEQFHNWLYALLAYHEGRGGAKKFTKAEYIGAKSMPIEPDAHLYIIHFLAFKTAFEQIIGKGPHPVLHLYEYKEAHGKSLRELAQEFGVDKAQLKAYNKWLKRSRVPHDADHATIIPLTHQQYAQYNKASLEAGVAKHKLNYAHYWERAAAFPFITTCGDKKSGQEVTEINGIVGIKAQQRDTLESLAKVGNIAVAQFLAFNDIDKDHTVIPDQVYYYASKRSKAEVHFHIAREEESWWSVAQKYGIKKRSLLSKNRLRKEVALKPGRVLWLRFIRPSSIPVAYELPLDE